MERHEALTESLELLTHDVHELRDSVREMRAAQTIDSENIRALARIAEMQSSLADGPGGWGAVNPRSLTVAAR